MCRLLGMRVPRPSPDYLGIFRFVESGPDVIHLEQNLPLLRVVMVGRRTSVTSRILTSVLNYERAPC